MDYAAVFQTTQQSSRLRGSPLDYTAVQTQNLRQYL
jgi:hypothetical protein